MDAGWSERLISAALLLAFAYPIELRTDDTMVAVAAAAILVTALNVGYWKLRGKRLREVYDL